jgi:zinc transport system substrate-binding protein
MTDMTRRDDVRTVVVRSPSLLRETGGVIRAVAHIAFWTALVMGASWCPGRGAGPSARRTVAADELSVADLDPSAKQTYRACLDGLAAAEDARSRDGAWPSVEQLAQRGVAPFADASYRWRLLSDATVVTYDGRAAGAPTFAISVVEPDPGTPIDPQVVVDDMHHKLRDGTVLHVGVWIAGRAVDPTLDPPLDRATATPPPEDGWRRITRGEPAPPRPDARGALRIGVTLHPYYSWAANVIAGVPEAEVVPVLPGEIDAGNYQPSPADIAKLTRLDALVINGIGHDDFIRDMVAASGNTHLAVIEINAETALVKGAHGDAVNSHTFISFTNAIQQTELLARKLGELRPDRAAAFAANARGYGDRLRALLRATQDRLATAKIRRVITVHDGYTYLLRELGIELAGVVQPAHGLTPSAKELGDMIEVMKRDQLSVVLAEEDFPDRLLAALRDATAARVYLISHVAVGTYAADEFERVMAANAATLVRALVTEP